MREVLEHVEAHARAVSALHAEEIAVGTFSAFFAHSEDGPAYATPARPNRDQEQIRADLADLGRLFAARGRSLRVEFCILLWPELPPALIASGLQPDEETPLLVGTARRFRPAPLRELAVRWVSPHDDLAYIGSVMRQGFELRGGAPQPAEVEALRQSLRGPLRLAYAELEHLPAGTGCSHPIGTTTELSAISTLPTLRRRQVAARLTSFLAAAHFDSGGEVAWACTEDPRAAALFQSLGFDDAGLRVAWRA